MSRKPNAPISRFVAYVMGMRFVNVKVVWMEVLTVAVNVMDNLAWQQISAERGCGNDSVNCLLANLGIVDRVRSLEGSPTRDRTEPSAATVYLSDFRMEDCRAMRTRYVDHGFTIGCVAELRTPSARARLTAARAFIHTLIIAWFSPHCLSVGFPLGDVRPSSASEAGDA